MAEEPKPGILRRLRIKRVSLVDMGANTDPITGDGAHIMLYKRASVDKDGPNLTQTHVDTTDWRDDYEKATIDSATRNGLPDSAFAAVWTDSQGKKQRKLPIHDAGHLAAARGRIDGADIPASVKAAARRKIESASNKEKSLKKNFFAQIAGLFNEPDPAVRVAKAEELDKAFPDNFKDDKTDTKKVAHDPNDDMCKCVDCMSKAAPAVAKAISDIEKKYADLEKSNRDLAASNVTMQKALQVEIDKRANGEIVALLKSFKATPFDMEKDVVVYRKMRDDSPEVFERTMTLMKAQDTMLASSALMTNIGSSRVGEGSAWAQIEAKADSMLEKSTNGITREQAIEKVMEANPKLVAQHRTEQN